MGCCKSTPALLDEGRPTRHLKSNTHQQNNTVDALGLITPVKPKKFGDLSHYSRADVSRSIDTTIATARLLTIQASV